MQRSLNSADKIRPAFMMGLLTAVCAQAAVTGRVVDKSGQPVAGVAVSLDRQKITATTDAQGRFTLGTVSVRQSNVQVTGGAAPSRTKDAKRMFFRPASDGASEEFDADAAYDAEGRLHAQSRAFAGTADAAPDPMKDSQATQAAPAAYSTAPLGPAAFPAAKTAASSDTVAFAKTAYLSKRINLAGPDANLGDVVLYPAFAGTPTKFLGFDQYNFTVAGKNCLVVVPKKVRAGSPWIWRTYFWAHKPLFDSIMCDKGYYLAFMDAPNMFGAPSAVALLDSFYTQVTSGYGLSRKTTLLGISRGGLYLYNWALPNLDKVSSIYGDGAVMDFLSWPCGCYGTGSGSASDWTLLKSIYGFASDAEAKAYNNKAVLNMKPFAAAKIPIIHVYGEIDTVVPPKENVLRANDSLKAYGWQMKLLPKPNTGHVHGLQAADGGLPGQLDTLVNFILRNTTY